MASRVGITWNTITTLEYKGFRIEVTSVGKGWESIYLRAELNRALADSPFNLEKSRSEEIVRTLSASSTASLLKHVFFKKGARSLPSGGGDLTAHSASVDFSYPYRRVMHDLPPKYDPTGVNKRQSTK